MNTKFGVAETNIAKGVAVCLLLWHHLFFQHPEFGPLVHMVGKQGKICVAIFVLLSGYGLTITRGRGGLLYRFAKIFSAYWLVILVFVPLSCVLGRGFNAVYPDGWFPGFILQLVGLHALTEVSPRTFGFNPTWWFMSLLIPLYAVFPAFARLLKHPGWLVCAAAAMSFWGGLPFGEYPMVFVVGMLLAEHKGFDNLAAKGHPLRMALVSGLLTAAVWGVHRAAPWRNIPLAACLVATVFLWHRWAGKWIGWLFRCLEELGKRSMDIFLTHTFFLIFCKQWIYGLGHPLVMFMVLLAMSMGVAFTLERLRQVIGIPQLLACLRNWENSMAERRKNG